MKRRANRNPLSRMHYRISNRNGAFASQLYPVWGVTWNLRGRVLTRLGTASLMALSYHPEHAGVKNAIELLCVTAKAVPEDGSIHYSEIRMAHDFSRRPYPGARERVLDPREEGTKVAPGDRPNGSWVRLALEVDRLTCRSVEQNWKLPTVPTLPTFYAGFPSMSAIDMEITPALIRDIAQHLRKPVKAVEVMDPTELTMLAAAHWPGLWLAPGAAGNDTGMWLINTAYISGIRQTPHLFEDFAGMLGMEVWNPARDIKALQFENPTLSCAREQGIDLAGVLAVVARGEHASAVTVHVADDPPHDGMVSDTPEPMTPTEFACGYDEAVDKLLLLRDCVRGSLGIYSKKFTDAEVNFAVLNPETPLTAAVTNASELAMEDAIRLCRAQLEASRPLVNSGTTDEDLERAVLAVSEPLFASKMCGIQVLRRDARNAPEDAFTFSPATLGRDRVHAKLWAGEGWSPRGKGTKRVHDDAKATC